MRSRIIKLGVLLVIVLLAVGGCRKAGTWLVKADDPAHADAMVMLTGSIPDRVLRVADLYEKGVAGQVWLAEVGAGPNKALEDRGVQFISNSTQICNALMKLGIPADSLVLIPGHATSTRMEAEMVREYLQDRTGMDTLLLVTSSQHSRRAYRIFKASFHVLEEPPVLLTSSNDYTGFNPEYWWRSRDDIERVTMEYLKMAYFDLFERRQLRKGVLQNKK